MIARRAPARPPHTLVQAAWLGLAMVLALARPAVAQPATPGSGEPEIAPAVGFVNDRANVLSATTRDQLEAFLDQVKRKTGVEFAVLTVPTTAPLSPTEYKVKVFERWGIGKKGEDNGLLLLLALQEQEAWFETGYGLEGVLPDGLEARIVREEMSPRFRAQDYDGCVVAGVLAAAQRIAADKGVTLEWNGQELRYRRTTQRQRASWLSFVIWILIIGWLFASRFALSRRRWGLGGWGPYWGGGYGGWGGGFRGGGGFGGGGSFGGFGGGASGGGGGGGHL